MTDSTSNPVGIGIIGVGFMGYTHFSAASDVTGGRITAIATRSEKKRSGDWTGIQGNFGPPAGKVDLTGVNAHAEIEDLLADDGVDLVDICLPTDMHEEVTLAALEAGKHVLVEKPIAIEVDAAERMVAKANEVGRLLMVGHVLPFFPEFRFVVDALRNNTYGDLKAAHFHRVIAPPEWSENISDFTRLGGWGIDLHIHDNHLICLLGGTPQAVFSSGLLQEGFVNHVHSQFVLDSGPVISAVSGGIAAKALAFGHGYQIFFDDATLLFDAGTYGDEWVVNRPLTVMTNDGGVVEPSLPAGEWYSAFTQELETACEAVRTGKPDPILSGAMALDALKLCHAEAESIRTGERVALV